MKQNTINQDSFKIEFLPIQQTPSSPIRGGGPRETSASEDLTKVLQTVSVNIGEMADKISTTLAVLRSKIKALLNF